MRCALFHHDFDLGSETATITRELVALVQFSSFTDELVLVSSNGTNAETLRAAIVASRSAVQRSTIQVLTIPELSRMSAQRLAGYSTLTPLGSGIQRQTIVLGRTDPETIRSGCDEIRRRILRHLEGMSLLQTDLWIVIDSHRGENAAWTSALNEIAARAERPIISFWIRSLRRDGQCRYLTAFRRIGIDDPFVHGPGVHIVSPNPHDALALQKAGLLGVEYLPSAMPTDNARTYTANTHTGTARTGDAIDGRTVQTNSPWWLCSDFVCRESNVFEAALLALLVDEQAQLLLPHVSTASAERGYVELVRHAFAEGSIVGALNAPYFSEDGPIVAVDAWISTGTSFEFTDAMHQAFTAGLPFIARTEKMWEIGSNTPIAPFKDRIHHYSGVYVPLHSPSFSAPEALVRFRFGERIDRCESFLGTAHVQSLLAELDALLVTGWIDFSFLPPQMQYAYVRDARFDNAFRQTIIARNEGLVTAVRAVTAKDSYSDQALTARGPYLKTDQAFAAHFDAIHANGPAIAAASLAIGAVPQLAKEISTLASFRLLFD